MISRKGLVFNYSGGGGGGGGSYDWWNQDQKQWESSGGSSSTYYILCASYGLVSLVALVQLGRIQLRVPEYGWTIQKVFHLMNFLVNGLRALLFGVYKAVFLIKPKALEMLLMDLPGLLFFSTYTLLVLFWAEIYHQARSLPTDKLRPAYYVINGFVYFTQVCIWILLWLSRSPVAVEVARIFFSGKSRYYILISAEIVPSALVLFILRKLPPRRVSDQYQPIS
ncbi:unnamed protein product [Malus baccata var. baccata]